MDNPPPTALGPLICLLALGCVLRAGDDPFAGVLARSRAVPDPMDDLRPQGWDEGLLFRREVYAMAGIERDNTDGERDAMSRLSLGFEAQKRFSTPTRTLASVDYQGRLAFRDNPSDTASDPMGMEAGTWMYETHNAYVDFYNLLGEPGRVNLRAGYFYPPFGLNQQTDTHGTLLQLSNELLFGSERDWQATVFGALTEHLDYTAGYLLGAGMNHEYDGQAGMAVARIALGSQWLFLHGLEGGMSVAAGERVDRRAARRLRSGLRGPEQDDAPLRTWRAGADLRKRIDSTVGPLTVATEAAVGEDEGCPVASGLGQAEWLHPSRRVGMAAQFQRLWEDVGADAAGGDDARLTGVLTYYVRNDVGNANLHWFALAVERDVTGDDAREGALWMVQYYRYW